MMFESGAVRKCRCHMVRVENLCPQFSVKEGERPVCLSPVFVPQVDEDLLVLRDFTIRAPKRVRI